MPKHQQVSVLPYSPERMFDLVADVKRYPEFLPWVMGARIRQQSEILIVADLLVGFQDDPRALHIAGRARPPGAHRRHLHRRAVPTSKTLEICAAPEWLRDRILSRLRVQIPPASKNLSGRCSTKPCARWSRPRKPRAQVVRRFRHGREGRAGSARENPALRSITRRRIRCGRERAPRRRIPERAAPR